jgi:hypothetical protein
MNDMARPLLWCCVRDAPLVVHERLPPLGARLTHMHQAPCAHDMFRVCVCVSSWRHQAIVALLQKENHNWREGRQFVATQNLHMTLCRNVPEDIFKLVAV